MIKFENRNNGRYYYLIVEKDLFDVLVLTIIRGGLNHRIVMHLGYGCRMAIGKEIERITKKRLQRGYVLVT